MLINLSALQTSQVELPLSLQAVVAKCFSTLAKYNLKVIASSMELAQSKPMQGDFKRGHIFLLGSFKFATTCLDCFLI